MAHGGTSFAGWAGANRGGGARHEGPLQPDMTSYDYDAPIDAYGRPTEKFRRFREVLAGYAAQPLPGPPPPPAVLGAPADVRLTAWAALDAVLEHWAVRRPSGRCRPPSRSWTSTGASSATR